MASSKYDEDVYDNPFFSGVSASYPNVLEKIVKYNGILCVPKLVVASRYRLTKSDAMDHVLLPKMINGEENDEDFITASGKEVKIDQGKIFTGKGFDVELKVTILFTETFHTDAGGSYRVLCLDGYLNKEKEVETPRTNALKISAPTSYQQCLDLLWSHSGGQRSRDALDKVLKTYAQIYERLEGENLRSIVDAASTHFAKAMQLLLKDSVVRKSARHNPQYMDSLKLSVETYVLNALHKRLFRVVTAAMAAEDSEINKITRNLVDLRLTDLGIRKIFAQNIPAAKKELSVVNHYSTPMGRLFCLKRIMSVLTKPPQNSNKDEDKPQLMTSDDLLPILIFLVIKSDIPNWYANLVYMRHFHFAKSSDDDEFGFYLATVEAALEHIRTGNIREEIQPLANKRNRWNSFTFSDTGDLSPSTSKQSSNEPSVIEEFFKNVQEGKEKAVEAMLEKPHKTTEEIQLMLCHPLCSCDKCSKIMSVFRSNSDLVTAYTRDNRGYTALHMAAYYGQGLLIDLLIKNNAIVDATDYLGLTPLHLACQRGYQNVMLLLLHFSSDVMALDNEGNTPLHMACVNGHEDCVKALVFYDGSVKKLQVNARNEMKDTPLHLAAKWGFEGIVKTLLENGADVLLYNRKGQTPVSLAQNVMVQRLLQFAADGQYLEDSGHHQQVSTADTQSKLHYKSPISKTTSGSNRKVSVYNSFTNSRRNSSSSLWVETASLDTDSDKERRKRKEKLFKAIIEGDIQLVKFYLGVAPTSPGSGSDFGEDLDELEGLPTVDHSTTDMCHPLCQCSKCVTISRTNKFFGEKVGVNVRTTTGSSLLHTAVLHNHSDIVELLISLHADTSAQNHKSLTPLHLACCMRNSLITDLLVKSSATLDIKDMNGDTPLLIAASNGFINGVYTLIKAGANINATNNAGNTALHEATKRNLTDTVGLLVKSGIDASIRNNDNKLAIDFAMASGVQSNVQEVKDKINNKKGEDNDQQESKQTDPPNPSPSALSTSSSSSSLKSKKDTNEIQHLSMKDLFAAFEESDLHTLSALTASIRSFDREGGLKQASTRDSSGPFLTGMAHAHSISSFNKGNLRKVKLRDQTDPLYNYSLSSIDFDDSGDVDNLLTPMGDRSSNKSFSQFYQSSGDQPEFSNLTISSNDSSQLDNEGDKQSDNNNDESSVKIDDSDVKKYLFNESGIGNSEAESCSSIQDIYCVDSITDKNVMLEHSGHEEDSGIVNGIDTDVTT